MAKRKTTEQFIQEAEMVHGKGTFDYSLVEYKGNNTPVDIRCLIHGIFRQLPRTHLSGCGCGKCSKVQMDTEWFRTKAAQIHGDALDFTISEYVDTLTEIEVNCHIHGVFKTTPKEIIGGRGCPECAPFKKSKKSRTIIYGVATNDFDSMVYKDEIALSAYKHWFQMIRRCYSDKEQKKRMTYIGCSVCEEWLTFSNFLKWFMSEDSGYKIGYQIDKDIIKKGNKVYSPDTCVFVPRRINCLFTKSNTLRGDTPIGVTTTQSGRYRAQYAQFNKMTYLGLYDDPISAFNAYKDSKESFIQKVAMDYFANGYICKKLYDALMRYEVEITD